MSTLIVLGNINKFTFANSIVAANNQSLKNFNMPLDDIFIIHSFESYKNRTYATPTPPLLKHAFPFQERGPGSEAVLRKSYKKLHEETDWLDHLSSYGIPIEFLSHRVLEIEPTGESVTRFVNHVETILKGQSGNQPVLVDLTNGTTLHKTFLSIIAYILDLKYLFMIDITKLAKLTKDRGFLSVEILAGSYIPAPESTQLDSIAYLNLAEILRYRKIVDQHTKRYAMIDPASSDAEFFQDNMLHSIQLKLQADRKINTDKAIYRIAASALSASIEDLIRVLIEKFDLGDTERKTFGNVLRQIEQKLEKSAPPDFDMEFFTIFNRFMLHLRNSTTHKGKLLTDIAKFKAELAVKMAFPYIQFYTDIVHNVLAQDSVTHQPKRIRLLKDQDIAPEIVMYYGLDGDDTGTLLEELFCSSSDEANFRNLSKSIQDAIAAISKLIKKNNGASVVFEAGDDLLFKGHFTYSSLYEMQRMYKELSGLTCSVGFGRSFQEVYLALKLAKTQPGKSSIIGIELT